MTAPSLPAKHDYYEATSVPTDYAAPGGAQEHAICIIGGGFAGLATAMSLLERGQRDIVLIEAERIGHGASGRNGGFVFGGFSLDERALVRQVGGVEARALYRLTLDAVATIARRIGQHAIDCQPRHAGVYLADWFGDARALEARRRFMAEMLGVEWQAVSRAALAGILLTERYGGALFEPGAFHFHPLNYARGLARVLAAGGVAVHEGARASAVTREGHGWNIVVNGEGGAVIRARELVLCCGGYLAGLAPALGRAMLPISTYVMVTEPLGATLDSAIRTDAAVYDTRFAFDYYRPLADTRLLWGGRISVRQPAPQVVAQLLRADMLRVYPQLAGARIEHAWSGLMSYGRHKMPQLGRLPDGAWYAMGFGGHGVGPTTVAGEVMGAALCGELAPLSRFSRWGLPFAGGAAGLGAAQMSYWGWQLRDWARGKK
ncbi:MAG: NAD(P)/FAD-dependent oxidoreductase [Massilia sp.]